MLIVCIKNGVVRLGIRQKYMVLEIGHQSNSKMPKERKEDKYGLLLTDSQNDRDKYRMAYI